MASGDDIEAGRTTGASDRTILVGQKSRPSSDFVGDFIFKAAPQRVGGDPQAPDRDLDGIQGVGNRGGIGVAGFSNTGTAVIGRTGGMVGVYGIGPNIGVEGEGRGVGVLGFSSTGHGVIGIAPTRGKFAGSFSGDVQITGSLTVFGAAPKSAAVRTGKNEYRRLYSMESPESWFEDFGEGSLRSGRATMRIP